jgi:exodeoxyribonuclease III
MHTLGRTLRMVALNTRSGGGNRALALAAALAAREPDVVVVGEAYPDGPRAARLRDALGEVGLVHQAGAESRTPGVPSAVLIASRLPLTVACQPLVDGPNRQRVVEARVGGILLGGAYFPLAKPKVAFWRDEFLPYAASRLGEDALLAGDFNSGAHFVDEAGATALAAAEFARMSETGWVDAWRSRRPDGREFSWFSHVGNGFRIDQAFASPSLAPRLADARYDHSTRESGVSDHSALVVDVRSEDEAPAVETQ